MQEYWHIVPERESDLNSWLQNPPEADVELEFEIGEKDFVNSGKGSAEAKTLLKRLGVDPVTLRRIAVASYEAEINVTAHSKGGKMESRIYDNLIHIRFTDTGPGIRDIEQAMVPGFSTADDLVREMGFGAGLGLPNIKKNSDAMHLLSAHGSPTTLDIYIFF
jgi:anti-sigma regulatory factor (Ser/Thr protein kinase)